MGARGMALSSPVRGLMTSSKEVEYPSQESNCDSKTVSKKLKSNTMVYLF